jgi:two-component system response regulator DesR
MIRVSSACSDEAMLPSADRVPARIRSTSPMTAEERAALSIAATGLSAAAVADAMHTLPALVREWLASAVQKLGARSKLEAILIADRAGYLDPWP